MTAAFEFDAYALSGETSVIEVDGFTVTATIHDDETGGKPWENSDGHGPVSDWRHPDTKRAGELVLCADHHAARFYDFAEACKIALRDGWATGPDVEGETPRQTAERAARADYEVLRAWCADEWSYCGVALVVSRAGVDLTGEFDHALWGVELNYPGSDNAYLGEVADDLLSDALTAARAKLAELAQTLES